MVSKQIYFITWLQYATLFIFMDQVLLLVHLSYPFQVTQLDFQVTQLTKCHLKLTVSLDMLTMSLEKPTNSLHI